MHEMSSYFSFKIYPTRRSHLFYWSAINITRLWVGSSSDSLDNHIFSMHGFLHSDDYVIVNCFFCRPHPNWIDFAWLLLPNHLLCWDTTYNEDFICEMHYLFHLPEYFNKWGSLPREIQHLNDLHRVRYCSLFVWCISWIKLQTHS